MNNTTLAINEIRAIIETINENSDFMAQTSTCVAVDRDMNLGFENKHDYAIMNSAIRDAQKWTVNGELFFAEKRTLNFEEKRVMKLIDELKDEYSSLKKFRSILVSRNSFDTCTSFFVISERMKMLRKDIISEYRYFEEARNWKPEATIKKTFSNLHGSYVSTTKRNEKFIKEFIYRMKLEDEIDINPIHNPYIGKDKTQLIKITGFEYHKPFVVISAISAEDEHDRLTDTRSMDDVSTFYFIFQIGTTANGKEHPDMTRLRKFIWNKVDHSGKITLAYLLRQLIGRVVTISLESKIERNGELIDNPDYFGYPSYDFESKIEESSEKSCDYMGSYMNLRKHSFKSSTNSMLIAD